jgi:hypothetical protein
LKAWALAHKGKVTSDVDWNPEDPPQAYNNATVYSRISLYTSMAREVCGPEFDPYIEKIDGEGHEGRRRQEAWAVLDCR